MKVTRALLTLTIALVIFCVSSATMAYAQNLTFNTGNLYRTTGWRAYCAFPECAPGRSPDVTFNVNGPGIPIDFDNRYSGSSLKPIDWLTHSPNRAVNIVGLDNILNSDMSSSDYTYGTIIVFTGSVTVFTGEEFTISHDDFVNLEIGGVGVILRFTAQNNPPFDTGIYNGPSGTFPFQLTYTECCDVSATLKVTHN